MFSYYQIHPTSINKTVGGPSSEDGVTAKVSETTCYQSVRTGSCLSFGAKLLCKAHPKTPHRGFISSVLVLISTLVGILGILSIMASHQIYIHNSSSKGGNSECLLQGGISKGDASIITKGGTLGVPEGANAAGFTKSFADVDTEQLNTQVHFDTDSSFFVCDNSTTGHICNNIRKFVPCSIQQTNKNLTTANGTGSCLQEGTVKIRLIDDAGTQHIFILDNCLYHPESWVNLLSTRCLAEKFLDADGNPDKETCIESRYSTHVLTWSFGQFKKTFPTPVSGLPELLFDEGFRAYKSFCMQAHYSKCYPF